jgi:hypothetical protein
MRAVPSKEAVSWAQWVKRKLKPETSIFDKENDGKMMGKSLSVREKPRFPVSIFPNKPIQ